MIQQNTLLTFESGGGANVQGSIARHMQRMAAKTKVDQARKLSKLDEIAKGKSSKALRGKLKNMD